MLAYARRAVCASRCVRSRVSVAPSGVRHFASSAAAASDTAASPAKASAGIARSDVPHAAPLPLLIVGGGIAGVTLARACHLASIPFLLFERSARIESKAGDGAAAGTGIGLWGPAERAMNALGLGGQIRALSRRMGCAGYRTADGAWLAQPPSPHPGPGDIRTCLTLPRGDLQNTLLHSIPPERIRLGYEFESCTVDSEADASITVRFKNGEQVKGSLLVAADGINSAVRAQLYPSVKPKYCGYVYFRATRELPEEAFPPVAPSPSNAAVSGTTVVRSSAATAAASSTAWRWFSSSPDSAWESWGPSTRVAYVPLRDRLAFWFLSCDMDEEEALALEERITQATREGQQPPTTGLPLDPAAWHEPIATLLSTTPASDIVFTPIRAVNLPPSSWASLRERTVIIGDAAHAVPPNLASGGMMSIQDALQLASSLQPVFETASRRGEGQLSEQRLQAALQEYVAARKGLVRVIQLCSWLIAHIGQLSSGSLIQLRDGAIALVPFVLRNRIFGFMHRFYLGGEYTPPSMGNGGLYSRFLPREQWASMPALLHHFHARPASQAAGGTSEGKPVTHRCEGHAQCRVGSSWLARMAARFASMPPPLENASVSVDITQHPDRSEDWQRWFRPGGCDDATERFGFLTHQYTEGGRMVEAVPAPVLSKLLHIEFLFDVLPIESGGRSVGFEHRLSRARVRFLPRVSLFRKPSVPGVARGGFSIPFPRLLQPSLTAVTTLESPEATHWRFDVSVRAPSNLVTRFLMAGRSPAVDEASAEEDDGLEIAGYTGRIEKFDKQEVIDWWRTLGNKHAAGSVIPSVRKAAPVRISTNAAVGVRAFSTLTLPRRASSFATASSPSKPSGALADATSAHFRVLVLGGYGLFGKRVAGGLLLRAPELNLPPLSVFLNARNAYPKEHQQILEHVRAKANATLSPEQAAPTLEGLDSRLTPALFDANRPGELAAQLNSLKVHVVINCVGPFQTADYSIARTCIDAGVSYIDLADSRTFVTGFHAALDDLAKAKGVTAISGASSVPGLASAVVSVLRDQHQLQRILGIDVAIAPGNHTPRGLATMQSILGQVGRTPCSWRVDGREQKVIAWGAVSRAEPGKFHPSMRNPRRWLSAIDIPDLDLLPLHFVAKETASANKQDSLVPNFRFRAGLETAPMHWGLWALGWLVRAGLVSNLAPFAGALKRFSESSWIAKAGSDTGGMYVCVAGIVGGTEGQQPQRREWVWRLYAGSGEGMQIPATASVVLATQLQRQWLAARSSDAASAFRSSDAAAPLTAVASSPPLPAGAYPCLSLFSVEEFMQQLRPYDIRADIVEITAGGERGQD